MLKVLFITFFFVILAVSAQVNQKNIFDEIVETVEPGTEGTSDEQTFDDNSYEDNSNSNEQKDEMSVAESRHGGGGHRHHHHHHRGHKGHGHGGYGGRHSYGGYGGYRG